MPIYSYQCDSCFEEWTARHEMSETVEECVQCASDKVVRIPSFVSSDPKPTGVKTRVGDLTKEFIENSRKDLKTQKSDLGKTR